MSKNMRLFLFIAFFSSLFLSIFASLQQTEFFTRAAAKATPTPAFPERGKQVVPVFTKKGVSSKDKIQLNTFKFVTVTPSPIPPYPIDGADAGTGDGASGECGEVVSWAQKISDKLKIGGGGGLSGSGYDNLTQAIKSKCGSTTPKSQQLGQYWCTWIIIDSYDLAGISIARNAGVIAMHKWWKGASKFKYVNYAANKKNLSQVKPGFAIFLESVAGVHNGREHVAMVKSISIDARGNGKIISLESNSSKKSKTYPISNWSIRNTTYPVRGLGGK